MLIDTGFLILSVSFQLLSEIFVQNREGGLLWLIGLRGLLRRLIRVMFDGGRHLGLIEFLF